MIHDLRLEIPHELLEWVELPPAPFDFARYLPAMERDENDRDPNGELRLPAPMHEWLIEHQDRVRIDSDDDILIFADDETAAIFWLMFSEDFAEVERQRREWYASAQARMTAAYCAAANSMAQSLQALIARLNAPKSPGP